MTVTASVRRVARLARIVAPLLLAATASAPALAGGNLVLIDAPPKTSTLAVGGAVWSLPQYPGARKSDTLVIPALDYYASNGVFVSTDTGVGWNLSPSKDLQAGVRLWPQFGRSRKDGPAGLPSIGWRIQPQAFANLQVGDVLLLQSGLLYGAGHDRDGLQLELGATSGIPIGDDTLGIGVSATWANRAYRHSYFGVSAADQASSGLPAYALGAGLLDTNLTLSAEHKFGADWRLSGQVVLSRLSGQVAQSPVVQRRQQTTATLTLWRNF